MFDSRKSQTILIVTILSITLVTILAIGSWVFINQRQIAQKDRALQQQKEQHEADRMYESQQQVTDQLNREKEDRTESLRCNYNPNNC